MKKNYFKIAILSTMFAFSSCGGGEKGSTSEDTTATTEQTTSDALESEWEEVEANSEETEIIEEKSENPKYDKILDDIEKDVKKLSEMASKIGNEYGILDITEKQQEIQEDKYEASIEEMKRKGLYK